MKTAVEFSEVSKKYRLGITRESLPSWLVRTVRQRFSPPNQAKDRATSFWALRDVSFELKQGRCLALIGENGAGKTTILKLLSKITRPTEGHIQAHGKLSALIELGAGFHPDLTGRENIYLNATILGLSRKYVRQRFDEIVDFAGIEDFIETPLKRYSSGMAVRLGFSVASCIEPDILLIDEVLAVGDASFRQRCLKRIQSLVDGGTSIIFVSHNLFMVKAVCDSALYLRHGSIKARGETRAVIDEYERDVHLQQAADRPIAHSQVSANDGGVGITRIEVVPLSGNGNSGPLKSQDPAEIRIRYRAEHDQENVHVSVFVNRSDGLTCCTMRTSLDSHPIHLRRGAGTVRVLLDPLQLGTGAYSIDAYMLNTSDSLPLTPDGGHSGWFYVKGEGISCADDRGVYEPVVKWSHETC